MDSRDSSPRSRDPDTDHNNPPSFDDPPPSSHNKVKLMCSFGGRIQPRPHDNHLSYVAGDTKLLAVDRHVKLPALLAKLSSLSNININIAPTFFKYQLPGEDLDALISVTTDEDLHHMMLEYDRLSRASPRPARLRLFLFPLHSTTNFAPSESKPETQWFVEALNSVQVPPPPQPLPPNPDFLFGLDNKLPVPDVPPTNNPSAESECFSEDREAVREPEPEPVPETEIQNLNLRRLQIGNNVIEEDNGRVYAVNGGVYGVNGVDCFAQKNQNADEVVPLVAHASHAQVVHPGTVSFLQERNNVGYSLGVPTTGSEIYLIQTPSGIFQAVRPVAGPVGQPVYLIHAPGSVQKVGYGGAEVGVAYSAAGRGGARW